MSAVDELYQELILHHSKRPRNFGTLAGANRAADGHNPLCGDRLHLALRVEDERIADARFTGEGCAISTAAASVMTDAVQGKTLANARELFERFRGIVTGEEPAEEPGELDDKLAAFAGVRRFPVRVKCAMLPWRTLEAALANEAQPATTE